jgi:hypothetical protein
MWHIGGLAGCGIVTYPIEWKQYVTAFWKSAQFPGGIPAAPDEEG